MRKPVPPPVEVMAGLVTPSDSLAIYSGQKRTPRYVRVRRKTETGDGLVRIELRDGAPVTLPVTQKVKVASRSGM
jgi:hypothetical protein